MRTTFISAALLVGGRVIFATLYEDGAWRTLSGVTVPVTPDTLAVTQRRANAIQHRHGGRKAGAVFHASAKAYAALAKTALTVEQYVAFRKERELVQEEPVAETAAA